MTVRFRDRFDAGRELAKHVAALPIEDVVVVGLPLGGVPVAFEIARALRSPLDVLVVRTLVPLADTDMAVGAIAEGGVGYFEPQMLVEAGQLPAELKAVAEIELCEVNRDVELWRGAWPPVDVRNKVVVIVDDMVAGEQRLRIAVVAMRRRKPCAIIIATPVASLAALAELADEADVILCIAVEQAPRVDIYADDTPVNADQVLALLERARGWVTERDMHPIS